MTTSLLRGDCANKTPAAQPAMALPKGDWQGELYPRRYRRSPAISNA